MIIDFTFKNFTSFRDEVSFSMMKTSERQHSDHIIKAKYGLKLLPVAAIFGANASGKSNFIQALHAMKNLVVQNSIIIQSFLLDDQYREKDTVLAIKILSQDQLYEFSFSFLNNVVKEEILKKISSAGEEILYQRKNKKIKIDNIKDNTVKNRLNVQFEGTAENQLFLNNVYFQNRNNNINALKDFKNVYNWFVNLIIINPDTTVATNPFGDQFCRKTNTLIPLFDLGFEKGEEYEEEITDPDVIKRIKEKSDNPKTLLSLLDADKLSGRLGSFIEEKDGKYFYSQIMLSYKNNNRNIRLPFIFASDGSKRIIHLSLALISLLESNKNVVVIIDELDRSLHTLLAQRFINKFLEDCKPDRRSQLIFTTHDVTLMDQKIFRRDELWIVERTNEYVSKMLSLIEYKNVRNDKDIRRSYLNGRFGGIPKILL